jgi:hypothetical protein
VGFNIIVSAAFRYRYIKKGRNPDTVEWKTGHVLIRIKNAATLVSLWPDSNPDGSFSYRVQNPQSYIGKLETQFQKFKIGTIAGKLVSRLTGHIDAAIEAGMKAKLAESLPLLFQRIQETVATKLVKTVTNFFPQPVTNVKLKALHCDVAQNNLVVGLKLGLEEAYYDAMDTSFDDE